MPGLNVAQRFGDRQDGTGVPAGFRPILNDRQPFIGMDTSCQHA
jgi:hypothetical protein